ncbi:MAG: transglycosylase domain-containing protein [Acidobacteriia bacterium]|nr:transglycosylase domain-containing protein [Terriglobia bacterium]
MSVEENVPDERARGNRAFRQAAIGVALAALAGAAVSVWLLLPAWRLLDRLGSANAGPSRLYARPLVLRSGEQIALGRVREELDALSYHEDVRPGSPTVGGFRTVPGGLLVHLRRFPTPHGREGAELIDVRFAGGRVASVRRNGEAVEEVALEPVLLAAFLGSEAAEKRPLPPGPLPEPLVHAVLAAEDDAFFSHPGVSIAGIARAAWVDLKTGEAAQGGSTLTQQLVKNLVLSGRRTLSRKVQEAGLAVLLELRMSKQEILRTYLDAAYLGVHDGVSLVGVGAAARAYFGKDPDQLSLAEAATLAGMLQAPAHTSPIARPQRARARRDWVLSRMAGLGWVTRDAAEAAILEPVRAAPTPLLPERAPYFAEAARMEARDRLRIAHLESAGLSLLSTLDWRDQKAAEGAIRTELPRLEGQSRRRPAGTLQAALISLDPNDGAVLAYVGGRSWSDSEFDRVSQARRQAGSAFKPVVYAAAFASGSAAPATILQDEAIAVPTGGGVWEPRDDDGAFLGPIPARLALEESRNLPAVRLGIETGLDTVVATARAMGITSPLEAVPALALGASAVSPRELATVYATLAAGGVRPPIHLIAAALGPRGEPSALAAFPDRVRALPEPVAFLLTDVLRGVLARGTGRAARALGIKDPLAGKTGTSNDGRDAWFAGYSPDRVTVVWVGRDDDGPTGLTGGQAALPVWAAFTLAVRPPEGFKGFRQVAGLVRAVVDPASGELATSRCPEVREELFLAGRAPTATCHLHGGWLALPVVQPEGVPAKRPGFFRRLAAWVFGTRPKQAAPTPGQTPGPP